MYSEILKSFYEKNQNVRSDKAYLNFLSDLKESENKSRSNKLLIDGLNKMMLENLNSNNLELKRLNDSLDNFNYQVSHDLRTSFVNALSLTNMLEKYIERKDDEKIKEIIAFLYTNSNRSIQAIEQFLQISKLNSTSVSDNKSWCDLEKIIYEVLGQFEEIDDSNIVIQQKDFKEICFHEESLRSVFFNLISNAIKYRKPEQEVKIVLSMKIHERHAEIVLQDNGMGMSIGANENPFELFKRMKNSRGIEGSGVGLYLVKKMTELNGGEVSLTSQLNEGTALCLSVPLTEVR